MNQRELWHKFIRTGSISDYLEYKRARDRENVSDLFDSEVTSEFAEEFINDLDGDYTETDN